MDIKIYQINNTRDTNNVKFFGFEMLEKFQGTAAVDSSIYDKVYSGSVNAKDLEDVYRIFNTAHPAEYQAHSLSVSDVVEVLDGCEGLSPGFYFCDSFGFKQIDFEPDKAKERDTIKAILLEPGKEARQVDVLHELKDLQYLVGGSIELACSFKDGACIICNAEGKLQGLPANRVLRGSEREVDLSYAELAKAFRDAERANNGEHAMGYVVFSNDSFDKEYPLEARTYAISSNNKAFQAGMSGYSIYGSSLDGSDPIIRLDAYMAAEKGGKDGWKIERCYMKEPGEILDCLAGTAMIFNTKDEEFVSLTDAQIKYYMDEFRFPEHIAFKNGKLMATPFDPKKQTAPLESIVNAADNKKRSDTQEKITINRPELQL